MNNEIKVKKNNNLIYWGIILFLIIVIVVIVFSSGRKNGKVSQEDEELLLQEKKEKLVTTIDYYIQETIVANNNYDLGSLTSSETLYYIPISNIDDNSCIDISNDKKNLLGEWKQSYVAISYNDENFSFNYYFTFNDDAGYGMSLTERTKIKEDGSQIMKPIPNPAKTNNITKQLDAISSSTLVLLTPAEAEQAGVEACSIKTAKSG